MAAGTAGVTTVSTTGENIYDDERGCTEFTVFNTDSTNDCLINVPGLHDDGEFYRLEIAMSVTFRLNHLGIRKVFAKAVASTSVLYHGIISKTEPSN